MATGWLPKPNPDIDAAMPPLLATMKQARELPIYRFTTPIGGVHSSITRADMHQTEGLATVLLVKDHRYWAEAHLIGRITVNLPSLPVPLNQGIASAA